MTSTAHAPAGTTTAAKWQPWVSIGLKVLLLLLSVGVALLQASVPWLQNKAMTGRAIFYPLGAAVVPVGWWIACRRAGRRLPYPWGADILLTLPYVTDLLGNYFNLFDRIAWFDDLMHAVNWFFLTAGIGLLLPRERLGRPVTIGLMLGLAAIAGILWELMEFVGFIRNSPEFLTAYTDTLFDQTMDMTGAAIATLLMVGPFWPKPAPGPVPDDTPDPDPLLR